MTKPKKGRQYNKLFGPHVRKVRLEKYPELTAAEFAESVGITGPYLSNIENCRVPPPSDNVVKAIAEKLGQDVDILLAMAGYVDLGVVKNIDQIKEKDQYELLKIMKFMRSIQTGKYEFTMERILAFIVGRALEERRGLKRSELLPEMMEQLKYLTEHENEFAEEFLPTVDRGLRVLGPLLEKIEEQQAESEKGNGKKAKRR